MNDTLLDRVFGGSYWKAISPTPGTGIAQGIIAAFSATAGLLRLRNGAAAGTRIVPDYIRLIPTVVPASATRSELLMAIDDVNRYTSGGSVLTARNANMGAVGATVATVNFGALVLAAEGANVRRIVRAQLRTAIPVAFEEVFIKFGDEFPPADIGGTSGLRIGVGVGAVVLGPGHDFVLHIWHPGNATTGASWETEIGWWEL